MSVPDNIRVHDSELIGVLIRRSTEHARLDFETEDGIAFSVNLEGLKAIRVEDMTVQNVVSRCLLYSDGRLSKECALDWISWATSLSDRGSWLTTSRRNEWMEACVKGDYELLVIEPSAGAQIAAVFVSMSFRTSG